MPFIPGTYTVHGLTFNAVSPAYSLGGNPLTFAGYVVDQVYLANPTLVSNSSNAVTFNNAIAMSSGYLHITGTGDVNFNGPISGGNGIQYYGTGTLTLNSASNSLYTTRVGSGTLKFGVGNAVAAGRDLDINGGTADIGSFRNSAATAIGTLSVDGGSFLVPTGGGDYYLKKLTMGGGAVDVAGTSGFKLHIVSGGTTPAISGSGSWIGNSSSSIVNDTSSPLTINVDGSGTLDAGIILSAAGVNPSFIKSGTGKLRLSNTGNTANITATAGQLLTNDVTTNVGSGAFGTLGTGVITLSNVVSPASTGRLAYDGLTATMTKPLTLATAGEIQVAAAGTNLTIGGPIGESVANSNLSYFGSGVAANTGTLTIAANHTYTGTTTINGVVLAVDTIGNANGIASRLGASSNPTNNIALTNSGVLRLTGTNTTYNTNRGVSIAGIGVIEVPNASTTLNITGAFTGSGSLTKRGAGTLLLTSGGYQGTTTVEAGRLALGSNNELALNKDVTIQSGATLDTNGVSNDNSHHIWKLILNGGTFRHIASSQPYYLRDLSTNTSGGTIEMTGASATGLSFTNFSGGTGAITVNGNSNWTSAATSFINNGTNAELPITIAPFLTLTSDLSLAALSTPSQNTFRISGGGTLRLTNAPAYQAVVKVSGARLRMDSVAGVGVGQAGLDLTLDNATMQYAGPTSSISGLTLGANGGTIDVANFGTIMTVTGAIIGQSTGGLTKSGIGTLVLGNGAGTFNGLTIAAGTVAVASDAALGSGAVAMNAGSTLRYMASTASSRTLNLELGTLTVDNGATLTLNGAVVNGGLLRGGGTFAVVGSTALNGSTTVTSVTMNQTGSASAANFTNGGAFNIVAGQTLTWNVGTNTSSGRLTVSGTANVSDFVSDGEINIPAGGVLANSAVPMVLGGGSRTFVGSTATPGGTLSLGGQTLELNGGLLVNNGTISDTVNVNYGSLAKGSGQYGVVNVGDGGTFAPGNSPGIVTVGSMNFDNANPMSGGASLSIELAGIGAGTQYDQLHVTGQLSLGGTLDVSLINGFAPTAGQSFDILDWGARVGTFAALDLPTLAGGLQWNTSQLYTTGVLSVSAAPGVPGDYNNNGVVDAADYILWRKPAPLANEVDTPGTNNGADYTAWRTRYGNISGASSGLGATGSASAPAIPEPASFVLLIVATACSFCAPPKR